MSDKCAFFASQESGACRSCHPAKSGREPPKRLSNPCKSRLFASATSPKKVADRQSGLSHGRRRKEATCSAGSAGSCLVKAWLLGSRTCESFLKSHDFNYPRLWR